MEDIRSLCITALGMCGRGDDGVLISLVRKDVYASCLGSRQSCGNEVSGGKSVG